MVREFLTKYSLIFSILFFTSKDVGKGSGLGLDISRRIIVQEHKGNIRFESVPGCTNFQVRLPIDNR